MKWHAGFWVVRNAIRTSHILKFPQTRKEVHMIASSASNPNPNSRKAVSAWNAPIAKRRPSFSGTSLFTGASLAIPGNAILAWLSAQIEQAVNHSQKILKAIGLRKHNIDADS